MKILSTLFLLLTFLQLHGQQRFVPHDFLPGNLPSYKPAWQEDYPEWAKMLYRENINLYELEHAYEKWLTTGSEDFRPIGKYYKIWRRQVEPFVTENGTVQLPEREEYDRNLYRHQRMRVSRAAGDRSGGEWTFVGPKETFWLNESGDPEAPEACPWQVNVYTFAVAPTNTSVLYAGTETGFVNKTVDNGNNWTMLGLGYHFGGAITAIAIHPQNEAVVYAAAGQQIHRTTDGGQTWTPLLPPNQQFGADKLLVDEANPQKIFAAGAWGVYRSTDGGANWAKVWSHSSYDVHTRPGNNSVVYAISDIDDHFGVAISTNGGANFSTDPNFPSQIPDNSGGLLAVSPADPAALYAVMLSDNNTPLLYRGDMDQGTWELLATGQTDEFPMNNGQGFFDLVLEMSPLDADVVFAGTTTLFKSTNGGTTFSTIGGYGGPFPIHPDIQCMQLLDDGTAWVATDGGFTYSTDYFTSPTNADARNKNLIGSDMWGFDQGWNEDLMVGGRYHNGNTAIADFYEPKALRMGGAESPTGWVMKGKSRHVAFNDLGPGWILPPNAEAQPEGRFIFSKYPNMDEYGGRRGNLVFHPNYYEVIYLGEGNSFWKSSDMGVSFELLHDFGNRIRFLQIATDDPAVIYADVVGKGLYRSDDGGYTWILKPSLTNGSQGNSYWEGRLHFVISPGDAHTIYACLQNGTWSADIGKIFWSGDGGDTWEDWTGTLDVFTKTLAIQPDNLGNDLVYLFTSNRDGQPGQCYIRSHGEDDWTTYGTGYPAGMSPNHVLPFFRDSKIRVAGNGGIWENELADTDFIPLIRPWVGRPFYNCMLDTIQFDDHSILDHEGVTWTWDIQPVPLYIDDANVRDPRVVLGSPGSYDVTLTVTKNGSVWSKTIEEMVTTTECPSLENCDNPALLLKADWELKYVDSEEVNYPGYASMAFDDNPETIWHTRWSTGSDPYPHEIQIDLGDVYDVHEFTYYPRQDGQNGWIRDYELYISEDLLDWGVAAATGEFENSSAPHRVVFPVPATGRYFRLVALSEVNGNPWASAAELEMRGCYYQAVSTRDTFDYSQLKAFPVPSRGLVEISLPSSGSFTYSIHTLAGQLVEEGTVQPEQGAVRFDLSGRQHGLYVIALVDAGGRSFWVKVVVGE